MKRTIVVLSSLLTYGLAYGNNHSLIPSETAGENIAWNEAPVTIPANTTDQFSFTKQNSALDTMAGAVTYKISEAEQDYFFTVRVNSTSNTTDCQITDKQVGEENDPVWYTVESGNKKIIDGQYFCDITITRHVKSEEPFNPSAHFFKGNNFEKLMTNPINKIDVVEKNDVQYAAVAYGNTLGLYQLVENDANELVLQDGTNTVNTAEEIISAVTHYTANNQVYLAIGVKSDSGDARVLVYTIDNDGKITGNSAGGPLININLNSKTKITSIVPIVENTVSGYGYFAIALQGDRQYGYVQPIKFYRFNMGDNTYADINNGENKVLGLNSNKLVYFNQGGKNHLVVVNKNNPTEYKVESQLLTFNIVGDTIKITDSLPIETFGAENALNFTSNGKSYIAFNETYADDSTQQPKSQIFSLENGGSSVTRRANLDFDNNVPYQTLTYSLQDANMQQYDYLMYVSTKGSSLYQWDAGNQTVIPYEEASAPDSNGATATWEFVKKGNNDYYLLAVKNQENATSNNNNKVIETYQVTDR